MTALPPWVDAARTQALAALAAGRLGHALLIAGPAGIGKRALADALAARVLCQQPVDDAPCGTCRSCRLRLAGTNPDLRVVTFELNKDATRLRTEIVIEQVRATSDWLTLTPQLGGAQVVIVDPADAINGASANALLKTLEEPMPNRFLWLLASDPGRLPPTIRSRCQRLDLRLPARVEAVAWLGGEGLAPGLAAEALDAARGNPGLALQWARSGALALRREVEADLDALAGGRMLPSEVAQRWAGEDAAQRVAFAADIVHARAAGLTGPDETRRLSAWFDQANRVRELLRSPVRANLVITELLLDWRERMQSTTRSSHA